MENSPAPSLQPHLSVVVPAYNEAENLPVLYRRLSDVMNPLGVSWELVVVDDHSADATFSVIADLARGDDRVSGFRFSRNFGSHTALMCGLEHARGACAVVLAADLQDPPEVIPQLLSGWRAGGQVVWAVREKREGEKLKTLILARIYYHVMRVLVGLKDLPSSGADFFLVDREVIDALLKFREKNVSVLALLTWIGFRQTRISYVKQPRLHGRSGWGLEKQMKLAVDSIASFTYLPIRMIAYVGLGLAFLGFLYGVVVVINGLRGITPQGWASLMVVVLVMGGIQMLMLGVLGEYIWRSLDESRARPRFLIERSTRRGE